MHCICNVGGVRLQPFLRSMKCRLSYVLAGNNYLVLHRNLLHKSAYLPCTFLFDSLKVVIHFIESLAVL